MITLSLGLQIAFWLGAVVLVHHHVGYPLLLRWLADVQRKRRETGAKTSAPVDGAEVLPVTLIVPAHNEERFVAEKMRNLASIRDDEKELSIVIALDGCTDQTKPRAVAAAEQYLRGSRARIVEAPVNIGKIAILNQTIQAVETPIVGLSDTSAIIPADVLERVRYHFADATVGFVAATYRLPASSPPGEQAYISYLTRIRADESELHSPLGVHGALYFFRRDLWTPLAPDTINDDFFVPMQIVAKGYRGIYDRHLVAEELERTSSGQENRRRVRIGAGNAQQSVRLRSLADPRQPWLAFMFLSGKGLRPVVPFIALLCWSAAALLGGLGQGLYGSLAFAGFGATLFGLTVARWPDRPWPRVASWLGFLVDGYRASLLGCLMYFRRQRIADWQGRATAPTTLNVVWSSSISANTAWSQTELLAEAS